MSTEVNVAGYLERIGLDSAPSLDLAGLSTLMSAHLTTVPFENVDVAAGRTVRTDLEWSLDKVVNRRRGGWCFELNGAFGALLDALGFSVMRLGAAVLLDGPNTVIDHLMLEVQLDRSYLVDVGFGDGFTKPLDLNEREVQDGGVAAFELIPSSQGLTLTRHDDTGFPVPQYRFRRVALELSDFDASSDHLQSDPTLQWSKAPFATRLVNGGPTRLTLLPKVIKEITPSGTTETPVESQDWDALLLDKFGIALS